MYKITTVTIFMFISFVISLNCLADAVDIPGETDFIVGRIIDIEAPTIINTKAITVIDQDEKIWTFELESQFAHFNPSHMKYHMINGDLVKVVFQYQSESAIILQITDYP
jgi:hypothetical protein